MHLWIFLSRLVVTCVAIDCACIPELAAQATNPKSAVLRSYEEAPFKPLDPSVPTGTEIAVLRGNPDRGPSTMLMKMRKGGGRLHIHTADYDLIVIEGTMKHWRQGEEEVTAKPLRVGSYWFQPGGDPHADSCLTDTCVMFITWSGPRDARLVGDQD